MTEETCDQIYRSIIPFVEPRENSISQYVVIVKDKKSLKKNCVNANNPEKRINVKIVGTHGNSGEQLDTASKYVV